MSNPSSDPRNDPGISRLIDGLRENAAQWARSLDERDFERMEKVEFALYRAIEEWKQRRACTYCGRLPKNHLNMVGLDD